MLRQNDARGRAWEVGSFVDNGYPASPFAAGK